MSDIMDHDTDNKSPAFQAFYIESMLFTTFTTVKTFEVFSGEIKKYSQIKTKEEFLEFNFDAILDPVHSIILNACSLSGYFFPEDDEGKDRADFLKSALDITEKSPLNDPNLKGLNDNFHKKLDYYLANMTEGEVVPRHVGPLSKPDDQIIHLFRGYDPEHGIFEMVGINYKFQPIVEEIVRIHNKVLECQKNNYKFLS